MGVKVSQRLRYVVGYVDLHVEGEGHARSLKEACQALVHELHEENWLAVLGVNTRAKMLDNVRVAHLAEELALLLEALDDTTRGRVAGGEEDRVQHLGGAGELSTLGPVNGPVRADAERVRLALDELHVAIAEAALDLEVLGHPWRLGLFNVAYSRPVLGSRR